ncbi:MAG: hypothetical protein P4N59_05550 [Negativicutes bacterium]|nr:hypothetical protein [Negativicutes bacterium]
MAVINSANLIDKDFNDTFISQARACDVQASSIFDQRWKIIRAANMNPSNADENNIRKLDHEAMESFHPDAVFSIGYDSYTTTTQMAAFHTSRFTYYAVLTDYNSQKELWKGRVDLSPAASWDQSKPDASPSAVLAHDLLRKMAADGILKNCPLEIPAH